jgi:hypothetical protein
MIEAYYGKRAWMDVNWTTDLIKQKSWEEYTDEIIGRK